MIKQKCTICGSKAGASHFYYCKPDSECYAEAYKVVKSRQFKQNTCHKLGFHSLTFLRIRNIVFRILRIPYGKLYHYPAFLFKNSNCKHCNEIFLNSALPFSHLEK